MSAPAPTYKRVSWIGNIPTGPNKKVEGWKPAPKPEKIPFGLCCCGEMICEGDSVGMIADHEQVVCYTCWLAGALPLGHLDSCALKFPGVVLEGA